jgi:hypothetical protein
MLRLLPHDEEEEVPSEFRSRQECHCCHERLTYTDEIYQLEVVEAAQGASSDGACERWNMSEQRFKGNDLSHPC